MESRRRFPALADFFGRLLHPHATPHKMDRAYVSDFTHFIDHYLEAHPQELKEQHDGWRIYWEKKVDFDEWKKAEEDTVPDDGYGFYASAWDKRRKH